MAVAKPKVSKKKSKITKAIIFKKIGAILLKLGLIFLGISVFLVLVFKFVPVPLTPLMISRGYEFEKEKKEIICKHDWVPLEDISKNLQKAVISSEDARFMEHHGFDFDAIQYAYINNLKGKRTLGGSTISQQTAKNVFLWQGRSFLRKGFEAYFTVLIELIWGKERIMEVYLNSIEMGSGIYGAEAAAEFWYDKKANKLSKYEAAGIAAILPNPRKFKASHSSRFIERRKSRILRVMRHIKKLDY